MAYFGTTAASSVANPPMRVFGSLGGALNQTSTTGAGGSVWLYGSTNPSTDLTSANFFTDAFYLGMRQGDLVMWYGSSGSSGFIGFGQLGAVTTSGAAIGSSGAFLSSTR